MSQEFNSATLNDIINEDSESVYVLNNTGFAKRTKPGVIFMTISSGNEGSKPVLVPKTYVPFDLTSQISKADLLRSMDFRQCVTTKKVLLVMSNEAIDYLKADADAAIEFDRANQDIMSNNNFDQTDDDDDDDKAKPTRKDLIIKDNKNKLNEIMTKKNKLSQEALVSDVEDAIPDEVNLKIQEILLNKTYSEQETYSLIKNVYMNDSFTVADCQYILDNCSSEKTKSFVINIMMKLK